MNKPSIVQVGMGIFKQTQILSGIQFTTYFMEFLVVETNRFVGSSVNVILTWQTCGNFRQKTCFARRKNWHLTLRSGSLFASTEVVHRPRS